MDKSNLVTLLVAVLAFLSAIAAQRQSAKATKGNNDTAVVTTTIASRTDMETEAYVRARAIDTETIERQIAELKAMREELAEVRKRCEDLENKADDLEDQNQRLRQRVVDLETHEKEHHEHD